VIVQYLTKDGEDAGTEAAKRQEPPKGAEAPKTGEAAKPAEY